MLNKKNKQSGFTLMELVVSMGLFLFILAISMGSLLNVVDKSRKAETMRIAMDNLNLAMEEMARNIRQGYTYHCGTAGSIDAQQECGGGDSFFAFEPFYGSGALNTDQIVYRLNGTQIEKSIERGYHGTWNSITSPSIEVESLMFYYEGVGGAGEDHPLVRIVIHGNAGRSSDYASDFTIQTSVAQRTLSN